MSIPLVTSMTGTSFRGFTNKGEYFAGETENMKQSTFRNIWKKINKLLNDVVNGCLYLSMRYIFFFTSWGRLPSGGGTVEMKM